MVVAGPAGPLGAGAGHRAGGGLGDRHVRGPDVQHRLGPHVLRRELRSAQHVRPPGHAGHWEPRRGGPALRTHRRIRSGIGDPGHRGTSAHPHATRCPHPQRRQRHRAGSAHGRPDRRWPAACQRLRGDDRPGPRSFGCRHRHRGLGAQLRPLLRAAGGRRAHPGGRQPGHLRRARPHPRVLHCAAS